MENYFINPFSLVALVPIIVEFLKVNLNLKDKVLFKVFKRKIYLAQLISIGVSIILTLVGMFFNLGFLAGSGILLTLLWGIFIGLSAIGAFGIGYLEILAQILNIFKTKTQKQ